MTTRILFVCLGNICRSPTAEGVFRALAAEGGVDVEVDSAGTSAWHVGSPPDSRAMAEAAGRGIDLSGLRARQAEPEDFERFDLIVGMDRSNVTRLEALRPAGNTTPVALFLGYAEGGLPTEVPDPYYEDNFPQVFDMLDAASRGLVARIAAGQELAQ
ncbi:low molecular weight protein-tyrosine-phosphatase [Tropicimonas sp. S265A]|uniref:low molecular weight protein-tyrosine-phosphatase n=1 Tax=Tropicimonas sp. S265A TaxID=3415134 RepID=UPI003C7C81BE